MVHGNRVARRAPGQGKEGSMAEDDDLGRAVGQLAGGRADRSALGQVARLARSSMSVAGARSVATGRWPEEAKYSSGLWK